MSEIKPLSEVNQVSEIKGLSVLGISSMTNYEFSLYLIENMSKLDTSMSVREFEFLLNRIKRWASKRCECLFLCVADCEFARACSIIKEMAPTIVFLEQKLFLYQKDQLEEKKRIMELEKEKRRQENNHLKQIKRDIELEKEKLRIEAVRKQDALTKVNQRNRRKEERLEREKAERKRKSTDQTQSFSSEQ